jgi:hypothetical protein
MPAPTFITGFPPIDHPRAKRWLDDAADLAVRFSFELHGDNPRSCAFNLVMIHTAAHCLWHTSGGHPAWQRFDADRWLVELARLPGWPDLTVNAALTMHAFMCFLVKHGHIAHGVPLPCLRVLAPFSYESLRELRLVLTEQAEHDARAAEQLALLDAASGLGARRQAAGGVAIG